MNIPKSIKIALIQCSLEQQELAKIIGVAPQFISGLATGSRNASINMIQKIAKALDYSVSEFIALGE